MKNFLINSALVLFSIVLAIVLGEWVARKLEPKEIYEGSGGSYLQHETLGFVPKPGKGRVINFEFDATYIVNEDYMNEIPLEEGPTQAEDNVLVLGDSHTFALGVNREETYPWVLNEMLNERGQLQGKVWNGGAIGYSLSQYLLKYRELAPKIKAQWVVVGFSQATDLYDLIPPSRGGFIYGSTFGRIYHDLDENGNLIEIDDLKGKYSQDGNFALQANTSAALTQEDGNGTTGPEVQEDAPVNRIAALQRFKDQLHYRSALYRMLKRSKLAMWVATRFRPGGQSLWPGLDTSLKIALNEDDQYRLDLAKAILAQLKKETEANGSQLLLVHIPYLATVYDEVWEASFGSQPEVYDRFLGGQRMETMAHELGIAYLDITPAFLKAMESREEWLHLPKDGHPNAAGHEVIARDLAAFFQQKEY